jgi:plasmid stability protein
MATLKIALDAETYTALINDAARHLRPADWHAKAILRQALGLPFPYPPVSDEPIPQANAEATACPR